METPTTVNQVYQLYKRKILDIDDCAHIFNIQPGSVHQKFQRLKNNDLKRMELLWWERERLIEKLEPVIPEINNTIDEINNVIISINNN